MTRITLHCTGKGRHGRIDSPGIFDVDGDTVTPVTFRQGRIAATRWADTDDGGTHDAPPKGLIPVTPAVDERGTWRWTCPKCRRDYRYTADNLRTIIVIIAGAGVPPDLSVIPR